MQARTGRSHGIERSGGLCRLAACRLAVRLAVRMLVALGLLAIVVTGSAAAAFAADRSPTPAQVKYYIVPPAGHGPATLFEIAAQTLGNGNRFWQIYRLNKGRLQPDGRRLENPKIIEPGWVLELPPYASGPGVHVGPLPQPSPSASTGPTSPAPRPSGHASSSSPASAVIIAGFVLAMIGALAVVGALLGRSRTSRHRRVTDRGRGRLAQPRIQEEPPLPDAIDPVDWSWPSNVFTPADLPADHPSRPLPAVPYQDWPADHPSRPQPAVDYRDWPADHPSRPLPAVYLTRTGPRTTPAAPSPPSTTGTGPPTTPAAHSRPCLTGTGRTGREAGQGPPGLVLLARFLPARFLLARLASSDPRRPATAGRWRRVRMIPRPCRARTARRPSRIVRRPCSHCPRLWTCGLPGRVRMRGPPTRCGLRARCCPRPTRRPARSARRRPRSVSRKPRGRRRYAKRPSGTLRRCGHP